MQPRSRASLAALALLVGLALALAGAEISLRLAGFTPWHELVLGPEVPLMHEPDEELGWRNKPGRYVFSSPPIRMTFAPDHTRLAAAKPNAAARTVLVLGCSFVQGWALSDEQTFAWKLQERLSGARVLNFGTAGYGTTQSLLTLKRYLASGGEPPALVIYGFSDFHAGRNVANADWLATLAHFASRGHVATPYATLENGALVIHAPRAYPAWPLHRELSTVALLEEGFAQLEATRRTSQARAVTENLLLELDYVVRQSGATLLVAMLSELEPGALEPYRKMLAARNIPTAWCVHPGAWSKEMQVPLYGHPNEAVNTYWAACIERAVADIDPSLRAQPRSATGEITGAPAPGAPAP